MRLSYRLIVSLIVGMTAVSLLFALYQAGVEMQALREEVQRQALLLAESQQRSVEPLIESGSYRELQAVVDRFQNHERLSGAAVYDAAGKPVAVTPGLAAQLSAAPPAVALALQKGGGRGEFTRLQNESMHVFALPLRSQENRVIGAIAIFHNVAYMDARRAAVWRHALAGVAVQMLLIALITMLIVRWSLGKPLQKMAHWLHDLRTGKVSMDGGFPNEEIFQPLAHEATRLATSLNAARAAAEEEARLRESAQALWTAERLRISVENTLKGSRLFVVSNREPYEHVREGNSIAWSVPPSGLVTALEPVLRACDGTWIAQATGNADREASDAHGRLRVPPDHPQYTLRRVWLTTEEEEGFYFGFANEGLWPLCHIAHTRPAFRAGDWEHYQAVNRKFADALLDEMEGEPSPAVLVQDYHFALLPRMIKEGRPDARVAIFWHIPWPNPEAFAICPWQRELLDGMLGADLVGFHIQAHCNNFLETVDRTLESRIDREHFAVNRREHITAVKPFPISVEYCEESPVAESSSQERERLFRKLGVEADYMGVGVDRVDYTKGIPERFRGIERFLDQYPHYQRRLTFVQIGAPSRTHIRRYQDLMKEVEVEADRINRRFGTGAWKPIVFLERHHNRAEITPYYRAANFCLVTSLHDGMNLVAKEYVASRLDEQGSLILSRFAGASHELADALIVNPYDTDELASAIRAALEMPREEIKARMQRLRAHVNEHNVYRWAGSLIGELAAIRLEITETGPTNGWHIRPANLETAETAVGLGSAG